MSTSSGFAFALAARSAMKDTTSAGSGTLALASPPGEGAPARAAAGRAAPAPAPGPGRGEAGERIWVQMARPAARKTASTAEPAVVTCERLAAEAEPSPASAAPHSVQNLAPASAFVPHWAQKRTDIGGARDTNRKPAGGPAASNRWRSPSYWRRSAPAGLHRGSGIPLREPAYGLLCLAATHVRREGPNTAGGGRPGGAARRRARARGHGRGGDRGGHGGRRPRRPAARRRAHRAACARPPRHGWAGSARAHRRGPPRHARGDRDRRRRRRGRDRCHAARRLGLRRRARG